MSAQVAPESGKSDSTIRFRTAAPPGIELVSIEPAVPIEPAAPIVPSPM